MKHHIPFDFTCCFSVTFFIILLSLLLFLLLPAHTMLTSFLPGNPYHLAGECLLGLEMPAGHRPVRPSWKPQDSSWEAWCGSHGASLVPRDISKLRRELASGTQGRGSKPTGREARPARAPWLQLPVRGKGGREPPVRGKGLSVRTQPAGSGSAGQWLAAHRRTRQGVFPDAHQNFGTSVLRCGLRYLPLTEAYAGLTEP